jgi:hypothetical protein
MVLFLLFTNILTLYMLYKATRPENTVTENVIEFTTKKGEIIYGIIENNKCFMKKEDLLLLTGTDDKKVLEFILEKTGSFVTEVEVI